MEGFIGRVALKRNDMAGLRSKNNLTSFIRRSKINGTVLTVYGTHKAYCPAGWRLVSVPCYEWDALAGREAQRDYLRRRLSEVGVTCTGAREER